MGMHSPCTRLCVTLLGIVAAADTYQPTWESLDQRNAPTWYAQYKFGIKMHWGVFSVPSFSTPNEDACWYGNFVTYKQSHQEFHNRTYGWDFRYESFAKMFKAEFFNATEWVELFYGAGARYIRPVVKFMDGFAMWPSRVTPHWNSNALGPRRDIVGELYAAGRSVKSEWGEPLKMGIHFELLNWDNTTEGRAGGPGYGGLGKGIDITEYVNNTMLPHLRELVLNYQPDDLYMDGDWIYDADTLRTKEFLADVFNGYARSRPVVVNDRWGKQTRGRHPRGAYFVCEYGACDGYFGVPWTTTVSLNSRFGYNRNDRPSDYCRGNDCSEYVLEALISSAAGGGNLDLSVDGMGDGRIPPVFQEVLGHVGSWLRVYGEAIYNSTGHVFAPLDNSTCTTGPRKCYTRRGDNLYVVLLEWPFTADNFMLTLNHAGVEPTHGTVVKLLGASSIPPLDWTVQGQTVETVIPALWPSEMPLANSGKYVIRYSAMKFHDSVEHFFSHPPRIVPGQDRGTTKHTRRSQFI